MTRTKWPHRIALLLSAVALLAQSGETYKTRLSAVAADQRTRAELTGSGTATAQLSGSKLTVTGTFEGLRSPAVSARLHSAVAAAVRGPQFHELIVTKATSGSISGSAELTPQQLQNLRKGGVYIQIQSEKAPEGVLWGWLQR